MGFRIQDSGFSPPTGLAISVEQIVRDTGCRARWSNGFSRVRAAGRTRL